MIHSPEIWKCLQKYLPKRKWVSLQEIYRIVGIHMILDDEDFEWQSPASDTPKWKRNVRNTLQARKKKGKIEWNGQGKYRI